MLYRDYGKRALDVLITLVVLIAAAPILAAGAFAIACTMGRPILFRQLRTGHHGHAIKVIKLRTMANTVDEWGRPLPDGERITRVGRALRRWSVDELPQLWNVLRGDMSLVGPRPLLEQYDPHYLPPERARFSVRPGITGWAQINGRNDSSWEERLGNDAWYAQHVSLTLDLRIIGITVQRILTGEGMRIDPRAALRDLDQIRGEAALERPATPVRDGRRSAPPSSNTE